MRRAAVLLLAAALALNTCHSALAKRSVRVDSCPRRQKEGD